MAKLSFLSLSLSLLLLFHCCVARQQGRQVQQGECQIERLNALEPTERLQAEAGVTELWDSNNEQFRCAGVQVIRHTIQPRGLLMPSYNNAPLLVYYVQGEATVGIMMPGCPETYQSPQQSQEEEQGQRVQDRHQKVRQFRRGDIMAIPAGAAHWMYNNGNRDLIVVVLFDAANNDNQLEPRPRRFLLAGKMQADNQQPRYDNVFHGFDVQTLAEAFRVSTETARKLQGEDDERRHIIRIEGGLQVIRPPMTREEEERQEQGGGNELEGTVCSTRLGENLDDPSRADVYNPRAGRLSTLNSYNLPVLKFLRLSAERGVLYRNAMMAPHWNLNAHSVVYVTRGDLRLQMVNNRGRAVFDGVLREGQLLIVPQNFAVVKQAGNQGCEWVAFKTNDNAMINTLSGRTSALSGLPLDVLANAYQISREEAQRVKYNRMETTMFGSSSSLSSGIRASS